jgi:HSP20 family protein
MIGCEQMGKDKDKDKKKEEDEKKAKKRNQRGPTKEFWDEFFGTSLDDFINVRKRMDRIFQSTMRSIPDHEIPKTPFIYGFSFKVGPDGIPRVQRFGNTGLGKRFRSRVEGDESAREPLTDVIEAEDHIAITIEIPGVEKQDIDIDLDDNLLTIDVDTESRKFHKELDLPDGLDLNSIEATYKNGVLDIEIKRKKEKKKKGKKIDIN